MNVSKIKYLLAIAFALVIVAAIVCISIYHQDNRNKEETVVDQMISNAKLVNFWDLDLEGCTLSNITSESFYSTKLDKSIQDRFYVIYDYVEYTAWQEKHNDIVKVYPETGAVSSAEQLFENGKVAVITVCSELQDTSNETLVYCVYTDDENNVTVSAEDIDEFENDCATFEVVRNKKRAFFCFTFTRSMKAITLLQWNFRRLMK